MERVRLAAGVVGGTARAEPSQRLYAICRLCAKIRKHCSRIPAGTACACSLDGGVTKVTTIVACECIFTLELVHSVPSNFTQQCGCKKIGL